MERPHFVTAEAFCPKNSAVECFSIEKQKNRLVLASDLSLIDSVRDLTQSAKFWLPIASEKLNISANISDYILTPIISMPSDLPNRNGQAFPYKELTSWCTDQGMPAYKTWTGKPLHKDHVNDNPAIAKGVILDVIMRPLKCTSGDIWKVIKLGAWDRTRDPVLASDILSGKANCYSMGAHARDFSCSVCSSLMSKGGCEHVQHGKPAFGIYGPTKKLAYNNCVDVCGFECSSVTHPAFNSASNMPRFGWLS